MGEIILKVQHDVHLAVHYQLLTRLAPPMWISTRRTIKRHLLIHLPFWFDRIASTIPLHQTAKRPMMAGHNTTPRPTQRLVLFD